MPESASFDFIPVNFLPAQVTVERRADASLVLRSPEPLQAYARCLGEHLERWASERPAQTYLAQRRGETWCRPQDELFADERVREHVRLGLAQLKAEGGGSSTYATGALLLSEPASIDAGEITDKGYVNQRAVLERRAEWVAQLYDEPLSAAVISLKSA